MQEFAQLKLLRSETEQQQFGSVPGEVPGIVELGRTLRRHQKFILFAALIGALLGHAAHLLRRPMFRASTTLELQEVNADFLNMRSLDPTIASPNVSSPIYMATQGSILQSRALVARAVDKIGLTYSPSFLAAAFGAFRPFRTATGSERDLAIEAAMGRLTVQTSSSTRIVEVTFDWPDRKAAVNFCRTLVEEYMAQNVEARWKSSNYAGEWVSKELADSKAKLESSEAELQSYMRSSGLIYIDQQRNVGEDRLREIQTQLTQAQAERITRKARYDTARSSGLRALPESPESNTVTAYKTQLAELRRQSAELTATLTPAHYKVKRVQAQIAETEKALAGETGSMFDIIQSDYEAALRRERMLAAAYDQQAKLVMDQNAKAIRYRIIKREVDKTREGFDSMLQKVRDAAVASAIQASNVRIVNPAEVPSKPLRPYLFLGVGLATSTLLAMLFVLVKEQADHHVKAPGELAFHLRIPELGVIPSAEMNSSRSVSRGLRRLNPLALPAYSDHADRDGLSTWYQQQRVAEHFRAAVTSFLLPYRNGQSPHILVVTSATPQEGKTTVVANLGTALSEISFRVVLVDCDLRRPRLHELLNVCNSSGVSDLLTGDTSITDMPMETLVHQTITPGLFLLPSGPGSSNVPKLLASRRMEQLLQRLRKEFDLVLVDTPPMQCFADARILANKADGVVLVVRAGQTTREVAAATVNRLVEDRSGVLGGILNDWNPQHGGKAYYMNYVSANRAEFTR